MIRDWIFFEHQGQQYFLVVYVKGLRSREDESKDFSLNNWKKGISSDEVVRNCLGGQIRSVRHAWGCSFSAGEGTCPHTRSHLKP